MSCSAALGRRQRRGLSAGTAGHLAVPPPVALNQICPARGSRGEEGEGWLGRRGQAGVCSLPPGCVTRVEPWATHPPSSFSPHGSIWLGFKPPNELCKAALLARQQQWGCSLRRVGGKLRLGNKLLTGWSREGAGQSKLEGELGGDPRFESWVPCSPRSVHSRTFQEGRWLWCFPCLPTSPPAARVAKSLKLRIFPQFLAFLEGDRWPALPFVSNLEALGSRTCNTFQTLVQIAPGLDIAFLDSLLGPFSLSCTSGVLVVTPAPLSLLLATLQPTSGTLQLWETAGSL